MNCASWLTKFRTTIYPVFSDVESRTWDKFRSPTTSSRVFLAKLRSFCTIFFDIFSKKFHAHTFLSRATPGVHSSDYKFKFRGKGIIALYANEPVLWGKLQLFVNSDRTLNQIARFGTKAIAEGE